jgi:hypothetical protein
LVQHTQTEKNYRMDIKFTKWSQNQMAVIYTK